MASISSATTAASSTSVSSASSASISSQKAECELKSSETVVVDVVDDEDGEKKVRIADHLDVDVIQEEQEQKQKRHESEEMKSAPHTNGSSSSSSSTDSSSPAIAPVTTSDLVSEMKNIRLGKDESGAEFYDVRIAVVGNVDSGKSTLVGVLTAGQLDNGRGSARSRVFVHAHESTTGRTSCISQHIMGYDHENHPVHQNIQASASAAQKTKSWQQVVNASRNVITFIDLAGHERYLKTTIAGLTGLFPDYAFVIVNSLAGITKMTKEHLGVVIALDIPLVVIVTKIDLVPSTVLDRTKAQLDKILKSPAAKKLPLTVRTQADVDTCINNVSARMCPIFFLSCVQGTNLELLYSYMAKLKPRVGWLQDLEKPSEFNIDDTFNVSGVGVVASGTVRHGFIRANQQVLLGPIAEANGSSWMPVLVRTVHCKRVAVESVHAGNSCALSLRAISRKDALKRQTIRRGMVLVAPEVNPRASRFFESEVLILHHPTTIKIGYQAVIHCGIIRQTACIINISVDCLRSGDRANVRFKFLMREEYLHIGTTFVFREGSTKGIGRISKIHFTEKEMEEFEEDERKRRLQHKQHKLVLVPQHSEELNSESETAPNSAASTSSPTSSSTSAISSSGFTAIPKDAAVGAILATSTGKVDELTGAVDDKRAKGRYNRKFGPKEEKDKEKDKVEKEDAHTHKTPKKAVAATSSVVSSAASTSSSAAHTSASLSSAKEKGKEHSQHFHSKFSKKDDDKSNTMDDSGKKKGSKR